MLTERILAVLCSKTVTFMIENQELYQVEEVNAIHTMEIQSPLDVHRSVIPAIDISLIPTGKCCDWYVQCDHL